MPTAQPVRGARLVAAAASTWGLWSLCFRPAEALGPLAPSMEALVAFSVVLVGLFPFALRDAWKAPRRPWSAWAALLAYGVTDALNALLFFAAMQRTSLAVAVLTHYLAPLLVALLAPPLLGEPFRKATLSALALSLAGLLLLLEPWRPDASGALLGAALGAASAVFYCANVLLAKRLTGHFTPAETMSFHQLSGAPVLALAVPAGGFAITGGLLGILLAGGAVGGVAAGVLFTAGLSRIEAGRAAVLTLLEPTVAVAVGALVFGEVPGPAAAAGAALVLAGAWLVVRPPRPDPAPAPAGV